MQRRKFLLTSLLAAPLTTFANFTFSGGRRPKKGFMVRAAENRFLGKTKPQQDNFGRCIISGADTDGDLYVSESSGQAFKRKGGPGLHIHHKEDEIFYVISGEFLFQLGEDIFLAKAGDTAFIPRGTAHTFANFTENSTGRLITIHQPITPELEKFYEAFSRIGYMNEEEVPKLFTEEEFSTLMANNTFIGPPIDVDAALKKLGIKKP